MSKFRHLKEAGLPRKYQELVLQGIAADRCCLSRILLVSNPQVTSRRKSDFSVHTALPGRIKSQLKLLCSGNYNLLFFLYHSSIKTPQTTLPHIHLNQQLAAHPLYNSHLFLFKTVFLYSAARHSCRCCQSPWKQISAEVTQKELSNLM